MRVAVLSYPMLFQTSGGLKMKVERTVEALCRRGVEASLVDTVRERLRDFDLVHLFAAYNGNHRVVEQAKSDGLPVVISTIMNPPFSKWEGIQARFVSRLVGKVTRWEVTTSYQQISAAFQLADQLIVLGGVERRMLIEGYGAVPDKITTVHNGIGAEFFVSDASLFEQTYRLPRPLVLHTGLIGDVKNQLGLVRALKGTGVSVALVGYCGEANRGYLQRCLDEGGDHVHYLGELKHGAEIASAYAAADVIAVPSRHEGMPNSILEALASDRPAVLTNNHSIDFPLPPSVACEVGPDDHAAIRQAVMRFIERPPRSGEARAVVERMSWDAVAEQLEGIYRRILAGNESSAAAARTAAGGPGDAEPVAVIVQAR